MKKLLLLGVLSLMIYSCKKETPEPIINNSIQNTIDRCNDSGICSEGIYETGPNFTPNYDTIIHETGSTTKFAQIKLSFIGYGTPLSGNYDTLLYKMNILNFDTNYIDMSSLKIIHKANYQSQDVFGIKVKTGKWVIFRLKP